MTTETTTPGLLEPVKRLQRDILTAGVELGRDEARFLVDAYYQMQDQRKRAASQIKALAEGDEPHDVLQWLLVQSKLLEGEVRKALDSYSAGDPLGVWARGWRGIGPVLSAGLLAHIDLTRCPTAGHIWSFAGLVPGQVWEKGQKRPWNADLKTLCFKLGDCIIKCGDPAGEDDAVFHRLYQERKEYELAQNEAMAYEEQAKARAKRSKSPVQKKVYASGKLPPSHIHARARRWVVKLFLSAYHQAGRKLLGLPVPEPYAIAHMGHVHRIIFD